MKKLFIIFAIICLAAPAMAADWNFYGSARFATFRISTDDDAGNDNSEDDDTQWAQQGNSRIGATVKFNDQIGGAFEMSDSFGKRKLYGTYMFGNGSQLLIGQTYTPSALFYSNSVYDGDGDLLGVGEFYEGRLPMIQWSMGSFKVALITPNVTGYTAAAAVTAVEPVTGVELTVTDAVAYDTDTTLPKIEVGYSFKSDAFYADVFAGYQTYELDGEGTYDDVDIDSYVLGGGVGANFGAFFVKVGAHIGQNLGNYGAYDGGFNGFDLTDEAELDGSGDTNDADSLGYAAVLGFTASDMLTFEAGYGHEQAEVDDSDNQTDRDQYYVNCTVNIAPGFFIVPEVGMIKTSDDQNDEEPETFYWGAKWQINF